jgi:hypothetical protein
VILLSSCHFRQLVFLPSTPCPQTCWSTRIFFILISLSWLLRTCNHELIPHGLAHNLLKVINNYVPSWACICIACAFGNLGELMCIRMQCFQYLSLNPWCLVTLLFHN